MTSATITKDFGGQLRVVSHNTQQSSPCKERTFSAFYYQEEFNYQFLFPKHTLWKMPVASPKGFTSEHPQQSKACLPIPLNELQQYILKHFYDASSIEAL